MKRSTTGRKAFLSIATGVLVVILTGSLSVASASPRKLAAEPPDPVLTWNTHAVNAVRASSPAQFETEGLVYMSYVLGERSHPPRLRDP